ncbi:hypothetical protein HT031_005253 [Scenedesmus sp. PABB004]|nr:hypothetical protein HT031_005253 [Scenedesmus sp. PABB004]
MGCGWSAADDAPGVDEGPDIARGAAGRSLLAPGLTAAAAAPCAPAAAPCCAHPGGDAPLTPQALLALSAALLDQEPDLAAAPGLSPLLLASLALIESGGRPGARRQCEPGGEAAAGLWQVLPSTAAWLAAARGYDRYGTRPSAALLAGSPRACAYFAAAALTVLARRAEPGGAEPGGGAPAGVRSEAFLVKASHVGPDPDRVAGAAAARHWARYVKARHCLAAVARAAAATLAAAAVAAATARDGGGGGGGDDGDGDEEELLVWHGAVPLVQLLADGWGEGPGAAPPRGGGDGSLLAQLWRPAEPAAAHGGPKKQQQQQHQQVGPGSAAPGGRRRPASGGAPAGGEGAGPFRLAPVSRGAFACALRRLVRIDAAAVRTAMANAAVAAATAAAAARAGGCADDGGADTAGPGPPPLPCLMHVVGHSETLADIAAACGVAPDDLLLANPELRAAGGAVQANDVIALPVPALPPRLYVLQPGDTLPGVARAHRVSLGRLLAANPELAAPSAVEPGWVVVLPALRGAGGKGGPLALDWAAAAAAAEAEAEAAAAAAAAAAALQAEESWGRDAKRSAGGRPDQAPATPAASRGDDDVPAGAAGSSAGGCDAASPSASPGRAGASPGSDLPSLAWLRARGMDASAAVTASVRASAPPRAAAPQPAWPALGSGAFLFSVGQSPPAFAPVPQQQHGGRRRPHAGGGGAAKAAKGAAPRAPRRHADAAGSAVPRAPPLAG